MIKTLRVMCLIVLCTVSFSCCGESFFDVLQRYIHSIFKVGHVSRYAELVVQPSARFERFSGWKVTCDLLVKPRLTWDYQNPRWYTQTALTSEVFLDQMQTFLKSSELSLSFQGVSEKKSSFNPFVMKAALPSNAVVSLHGDMHGDVHALNAYIRKLQEKGYLDVNNGFKIKDSRFYMVFLGDYTDRGRYGAEVIYTILRLKQANPESVFLVRGNHEDVDINARYGLESELVSKFGSDQAVLLLGLLHDVYSKLPVALYLGTKDSKTGHKHFVLCCHGGIEIGFDENQLLANPVPIFYQVLDDLQRSQQLNKLSLSVQNELKAHLPAHQLAKMSFPYQPTDLGFMWNDFNVASYEPTTYSPYRGWSIGYSLLQDYLRSRSQPSKYSFHAVFRAHQHSPTQTDMMKRILNFDKQSRQGEEGVGKIWNRAHHSSDPQSLWHGMVATFLVSPLTPYSMAGFNYDAFGLLKLAPDFKDWKLEMFRIPVNDF